MAKGAFLVTVDETFSKISPTWRSILALGSAVAVGALGMGIFQSQMALPDMIRDMQSEQAVENRRLSNEISVNKLGIAEVKSEQAKVDAQKLADAVTILSFQLCIDRQDRAGTLTTESSERCQTQADRLFR